MSSRAIEYSTLEDYLESLRSPVLPRSIPNFESSDTPPPLVDAPSDYESSETDLELQDYHSTPRPKSRAQPQSPSRDTQLLRGLGLIYYPEKTSLASRSPSDTSITEPHQGNSPSSTNEQPPMITENHMGDVSNTSNSQFVQQTLTNSRRASEKLNDAIGFLSSSSHSTQPFYEYGSSDPHRRFDKHAYREKRQVRVSITSLTTDDTSEAFEVSGLSLGGSPQDKKLDVRPPPPPKLMLPSLQIDHSQSHRSLIPQDLGSAIQSPTFAKFAITPTDGHPSQILPRIQGNPSPPTTAAIPSGYRQTLPSLETALKAMTDSNGMPYIDPPSALSRPPPTPLAPYGPSPSAYSHSSPTITMSPPRLPSHPSSSWRTSSHNSSNSNMSEHLSAHGSNNGSTPASSLPGQSPGNSMATPQYPGSDQDSGAESDQAISAGDGMDQADFLGGSVNGSSGQGYACNWPGCTAAPFQTQYLLNSHTNVHSNQRPHFCPVKDCPRGPGGQGFKRKNEMIRHGLVHQSPGYVCPFCPDQQHKYPRPDNLQRHVRVHHVEKDRDDPMLREVLAQRPEGGNRGRRRRLGG